MQIRKQLRALSIALDSMHNPDKPFAPSITRQACGCMTARIAIGQPWNGLCQSGYHGIHSRVRFSARSQSHGNATGQSKQKK